MTYLHGTSGLIHKLILEVRYRQGFGYLDRCGKTVNALIANQPEWLFRSENSTAQGTSLISLRNGCKLHFGPDRYAVSVEKPPKEGGLTPEDVSLFKQQVDVNSRIVSDELGLRDFTRIGYRVNYMFPFETRDESEKWVLNLGYIKLSDAFAEQFQGVCESAAVAITMLTEDRKFRITVSSIERNVQLDIGDAILNIPPRHLSKEQDVVLKKQLARQKKKQLEDPEFAGVVDIDVYQENPLSPEPLEFIESASLQLTSKLQALTATKSKGK